MKHVLGIFAIVFAAAMTHAQFLDQTSAVPAFHPTRPAPAQKLPHILTAKELAVSGMIAPAQTESYKAAVRASSVVYQLPCYCYCDRNHGHSSLRSCFESAHGANCSTCMQEALYAYRQSAKGKSARMIRAGIIHGDYKLVDLESVPPIK